MLNFRLRTAALLLLFALPFFAASVFRTDGQAEAEKTTQLTAPNLPSMFENGKHTGDYLPEWRVIDSLEAQGLFKSALEKVNALNERAKKDRNGQQIIKTLIFKGKYTAMLEEDGLAKAVLMLEKEIPGLSPLEQAVMQSLTGEMYTAYLRTNYYKIRSRTPITGSEGGDILTWSADQLESHARQLYRASLSRTELLRQTPAEKFVDISLAGQNDTVTAPLRPTLYDLLAHRALAFFSDERSYLSEPAYKFQLDKPEYFAPAERFAELAITSDDTTSDKWHTLRLYQELLRYHLRDADPSARIDVDLLRLQFVKNNSVLENEEALYAEALEILHKQYYNHPSDAEIVFNLASHWRQMDEKLAQTKQPGLLQRAVTECESAIQRHPGSLGASQCSRFIYEVKMPFLSVQLDRQHLPDKPVLANLVFKNRFKIYVRVVQLPSAQFVYQELNNDERLAQLLRRPALQQRTWELNDPGDYRQHATEINLQKLPLGHYALLASETADFNPKKGYVTSAIFTCTNLAAVPFMESGHTAFAVVHRETGQPLSGVQAEFFNWNYDRKRMESIAKTRSDADGMVRPNVSSRYNVIPFFSVAGDSLWLDNSFYFQDRPGDHNRPRNRQVHFFTDRAIYRPGQSVYFKGVLLDFDAQGKPQIVPGAKVTVAFYDANNQRKKSLDLVSNSFGTFNGVFTAPTGGLTGQMYIRAEQPSGGQLSGGANFSVEEYKRPKFETVINQPETAYRLGEKVTVTGEAKAYAGSAVDGAQVRYRVVRNARYPFYDFWTRIWPPSQPAEITSGLVQTDASGKFNISFELQPDRSIPVANQPVFDYTVYADVTDINGETRSGELTLSAGYAALLIDLDLKDTEPLDSLSQVKITATNLAGKPQPVSGQIEITKLVEPEAFFQKRNWEKPDTYTIPEDEFKKLFPHFAWKNEDNPLEWGRQDYTRSFSFNTSGDQTVNLGKERMGAGVFLIVIRTQDAYGQAVERKRVVRVWESGRPGGQFDQPDLLLEKNDLQPGQTARVWLGGRTSPLHFFTARETNGKLGKPAWQAVRGASKLEYPVTENDRGGYAVHWFTVYNNRLYGASAVAVRIPWTNKELHITYETFRDQLLPGQPEEWRLHISGPNKEKVSAEMVAALYDASLDQFRPHNWAGISFPSFTSHINWMQYAAPFGISGGDVYYEPGENPQEVKDRIYRMFNWFDFPFYGRYFGGEYAVSRAMPAAPRASKQEDREEVAYMSMDSQVAGNAAPASFQSTNVSQEERTTEPVTAPAPPPIRRNLNETVFFFPELHTDADGNLILKFTMGEALTRWKLLAFAHTPELQTAMSTKEVVTRKDLMILPNPPRFLRQGDELEFAAKVSNLSANALSGKARLSLLDAITLQPIDAAFGLAQTEQPFQTQAGQSTAVTWRIRVPQDYNGAVTWQVYAESGDFRDGEEGLLPVTSNRMLVTETLPVSVRGGQTRTFTFESLRQNSDTRTPHQYTIEFSSNPAWYAVQSLPYLMEYPYECSEQLFSRFYANTLASHATAKLPAIRRVYDSWKSSGALQSNLTKNQELKTALLEETPWVLDAQREEQQQQNIALLFDLNRMADEQNRALSQLARQQQGDGGFPWFAGGQPSWYITQYIAAGFGHLKHLGAFDPTKDRQVRNLYDRALGYCDRQLQETYDRLEKEAQAGRLKLTDDHIDGMAIHYLYTRSFSVVDRPTRAQAYYLDQAEKYWLKKGLYEQGLLALALHRNGRPDAAKRIVASLRERAQMKEELGMYWPMEWGYYWYQLPVETQALMVEVFDEVAADAKAVEELRIWLLKNKQTNHWESTKATAEAVYAFLLHGNNWLAETKPVQVKLGAETVQPSAGYQTGTGYFKESWRGREVKNDWGSIQVQNPNNSIAWGAAYFQYFEQLDKITSFKKTPLTIVKQLFREDNTPDGPRLTPLSNDVALKPGDRLKVRIEIRVDRPMEYVHLKDMRASGFEPVNVLSGYRWQGGLGYYESTRDLATHFFIDYLPRGTFVFEYPLVVALRGNFSNGITSIQCMYAPEFSSHSEGIRVQVK